MQRFCSRERDEICYISYIMLHDFDFNFDSINEKNPLNKCKNI